MELNLIGKWNSKWLNEILYFCYFERYIEDLMNGTYLQQTVETVVGNETGKQLMVSEKKRNFRFYIN